KLAENKEHLIVLSKSDLADVEMTKKWVEWFHTHGYTSIAIDAKKNNDIKNVFSQLNRRRDAIKEARGDRIPNFDLKVMVVGMPNVGKSTLLNAIKGRKSAKVGNIPGITKNQQWIRVQNNLLFLDTPGILMPNRQNLEKMTLLQILHSMEDMEYDEADLALKAIKLLQEKYPGALKNRYTIDENSSELTVLEAIAKKRGALLSKGELDYYRAGAIVIDELRKGKLGRITLENPDALD
ncbi:MAG: ribosome biogenesis GTPase YlqF, partial [Tissierellia bacterium]|nr:ribosome biogenesis GTPase YlqF [Tissierellia bacterium]